MSNTSTIQPYKETISHTWDLEKRYPMIESNEGLLSYGNLLYSRKDFVHNNDKYDEPGFQYFKIFFYFGTSNEDNPTSNLLGLPYVSPDCRNTAYEYLNMNAEYQRADYLERFIIELSDLSSNHPWYFQSIEGIDTALERPYFKDTFSIEDQRKTFTIKCIEDSVNHRIANMLNLYRSACWSHKLKKEIIPANLRKFDMGIFIFPAPFYGPSYSSPDDISKNAKYLEFHNCEIDPDSFKTCFENLDNSNAFSNTPSITISYDDCFVETAFDDGNEIVQITDFVYADLNPDLDEEYETPIIDGKNIEFDESQLKDMYLIGKSLPTNPDYPYRHKGFITGLINNTVGRGINQLKNKVKKIILGNVNKLSISSLSSVADQISSGNILGAVDRVKSDLNERKTVSNLPRTTLHDTSYNSTNIIDKNSPSLSRPSSVVGGNVNRDDIRRNL